MGEVFSFKPAEIIKQLNLLRPIYSKTTNYGHFGKNDPGHHLGEDRQGRGAAQGRRQSGIGGGGRHAEEGRGTG